MFILLLYVWPRKERNKTKMHFIISFIFLKKCIAKSLMHGGSSLKLNYFLTFPACFRIPIFFSNLNSNCSNLFYLRKLQEQVKKAFCYQKLFSHCLHKLFKWSQKFWNSRLKAENFQNFWDHWNNLFKQWEVRNPSIYNIIRLVAWTMGQMNRPLSVWCSK